MLLHRHTDSVQAYKSRGQTQVENETRQLMTHTGNKVHTGQLSFPRYCNAMLHRQNKNSSLINHCQLPYVS